MDGAKKPRNTMMALIARLVVAAYLLYIKTKTLLAVEEEVTELEQLMSSLEKLRAKDFREAVKAVLPTLADYSAEGLLLWTRPQEPVSPAARVYDYRHEGADLLDAHGL